MKPMKIDPKDVEFYQLSAEIYGLKLQFENVIAEDGDVNLLFMEVYDPSGRVIPEAELIRFAEQKQTFKMEAKFNRLIKSF